MQDLTTHPLGETQSKALIPVADPVAVDITARCLLQWSSPNAPTKTDALGTVLLSVLSGHQRYAHIRFVSFNFIKSSYIS